GPVRLSRAAVLGQILLLQGKRKEYLDLLSETVLPLLLAPRNPPPEKKADGPSPESLLDLVRNLVLLPAFSPAFLAEVPADGLRAAAGRWQALREKAANDLDRLHVDLFLEAAWGRLGDEARSGEAAARVRVNPARAALLPEGG